MFLPFCGNLLLDSLSNHVECIDNKIALFSPVGFLDFFLNVYFNFTHMSNPASILLLKLNLK